MNLLPAKMMPYAKAWVTLIGVIVTGVTAAVPDVPRWVAVVGAVAASVGAYFTPNAPATEDNADAGPHPV